MIAVSDWETSNAFYRDVVGAEILDVGAGRFAYRVGDTQLNVHGPGVDVGQPGRPAARSARQQRPLSRLGRGRSGRQSRILETQGVEVESGPMDTFGAGGRGTSVYFRDPDGSLLEFISYG